MHSALASFVATAPVLHALAPFRRFVEGSAPQATTTRTGKIYLGHGEAVIVCPTYRRGPEHTVGFRATLDEAGFASYDWGLGYDMGPGAIRLSACLRRMEEKVIDAVEAEGDQVTILGWGLSGVYAREVAKRVAPLVKQVITLGTPVNACSELQQRCALLRALEADAEGAKLAAALRERMRERPPVPCTSIFSRDDEIVPWHLSVEPETSTSQNIGVEGIRHNELLDSPRVLEIVSHRLAQDVDHWRPFPV